MSTNQTFTPRQIAKMKRLVRDALKLKRNKTAGFGDYRGFCPCCQEHDLEINKEMLEGLVQACLSHDAKTKTEVRAIMKSYMDAHHTKLN